ncbi:MAG: hypothetical protein ABSE08_11255 [Syntrophobacteraceae bacterium]
MKETPSSRSRVGSAAPPECFGDGDKVCPVDEEGIMQPQSGCLPCLHLRACVQSVMVRRGKLRIVEAAPCSKVTGFLKRWSDQKLKKS